MSDNKILIVEDDAIVVTAVEYVLRDENFQLGISLGNREDVLHKVKTEKPDLVLMDINLHEPVDGIELAEMIRKSSNTAIVFITAYSDRETLKRALLINAYGYLVKPIINNQLIVTIRMALHRVQIDRELFQSRQLHSLVLQSLAEAVLILGPAGTEIIDCNPAARDMFGYARRDILGKDIGMLLPDDAEVPDFSGFPADFINTAHSHANNEIEMKRMDGSRFPCAFSVSPVLDEHRKHNGYVLVIRDISEHKVIEAKEKTYKKHLQAMSVRITATEDRVRRAIARELHDQVVQNLALVKIQLRNLETEPNPDRIYDGLRNVLAVIDRTIADSRNLVFDISPPVLFEFGLSPALEWLTEKMELRHGIIFRYNGNFDEKTALRGVDNDTKMLLYRASRELLINAVKHARAGKVVVSCSVLGDVLELSVEDDGVGMEFVDFEAYSMTPGNGGYGLFSLREQISLQQGELVVAKGDMGGARVTLRIPCIRTSGEKDE